MTDRVTARQRAADRRDANQRIFRLYATITEQNRDDIVVTMSRQRDTAYLLAGESDTLADVAHWVRIAQQWHIAMDTVRFGLPLPAPLWEGWQSCTIRHQTM